VPRNSKKLRKEENVCAQHSVLHGPPVFVLRAAGWPVLARGLARRANGLDGPG